MRRRKDPWDQPWVTIAAIVGVIAVLIIALVFFMSGGNAGVPASSGQSPSTQSTMATQAPSGASTPSTTVSSAGINPEAIKEAPTADVPVTGAFVRVSYIGGFAGTYGINGEVLSVQNSGDRVFPLNATTGTVSATFHKEDSSTRHEIVVEIYKDGKALTFGKNSSAYGLVSINSQV